jgi:hypothetical protein
MINRYRVTPLAAGEVHTFDTSLFRSTWKVTDEDGGEVVIAPRHPVEPLSG